MDDSHDVCYWQISVYIIESATIRFYNAILEKFQPFKFINLN